jgi:hypothetical protein
MQAAVAPRASPMASSARPRPPRITINKGWKSNAAAPRREKARCARIWGRMARYLLVIAVATIPDPYTRCLLGWNRRSRAVLGVARCLQRRGMSARGTRRVGPPYRGLRH